MSMIKYVKKIKAIEDVLNAIEENESDHNLLMTILLRLAEKYQGSVNALNTHQTKLTFDQLHPLLMQEDIEV